MTTIYLIRHAESSPYNYMPEPEWPLSKLGKLQAFELKDLLSTLNITKIFSSPYRRALDTIMPFANMNGADVTIIEDFRERKLTESMVDDYIEFMEKSWGDFDYKNENCESNNDCKDRVLKAFNKLIPDVEGENIVISSHGNAIALLISCLDKNFGIEDCKSMRNPDVFKLQIQNDQVEWIKDFTWAEKTA